MSAKAQEVALDRVLVDRFKGGDQSAFDEMVTRYWDRIYSMVHQLLRNQQDAEEVTQDAFIRAHRGLANFRGDSAFSTWLYQIATNLARNRYWYWWRRKRDQSISIDAPVSAENDMTLAEIIPAEVESPDDITVTQEFVDRIAEIPEVVSCYIVSGSYDAILHVAARDSAAYSDIVFFKLRSIPGVKDVRSSFVMRTIKQSPGLPLLAARPGR